MHRLTTAVLLAVLALSPVSPAALARTTSFVSRPVPLKSLVRKHQVRLRDAVRKHGKPIELCRTNKVKLLVDGRGKLLYQPVGRSTAKPRRIVWWSRFRSSDLATISETSLGARFERAVLDRRTDRTRKQAEKKDSFLTLKAILPDGREIAPSTFGGGYHGTSKLAPEVVLAHGLPKVGNDRRLREHAEPNSAHLNRSFFRGTTQVPSEPVTGNGAAYWAGKGGWVYEIRNVPGWDVNSALFGRVAKPVGYRGNLMSGEQEIAIPAQIPAKYIKSYGVVEENSRGKLFVKTWYPNPKFEAP